MIQTLLLYSAVLMVASGATWMGSVRLERAASRLSVLYGLPPLVQGTLVVAVASSLPELSTVVVSATFHGDFSLGMATIVGSAVFNILVIPGLSALVGEGHGGVEAELRLVYRDALFYLTAVSVLLLTFSFAIIYQPLAGDGLTGRLTRLPALVPLLLYGLYLFLQEQEVVAAETHPRSESEAEDEAADEGGEPSVARAWATLAFGVLVVLVGVEALLRVTPGEGWLLLFFYASFLVWLGLETAGVTAFLGTGVGT